MLNDVGEANVRVVPTWYAVAHASYFALHVGFFLMDTTIHRTLEEVGTVLGQAADAE